MQVSDPESVKVWIVRHGERVDEANRMWLPAADEFDYDCPLTPLGLRQAHSRGSWVKAEFEKANLEGVDMVYSSPFLRTMQTAQGIAIHFEAPVKPTLGVYPFD